MTITSGKNFKEKATDITEQLEWISSLPRNRKNWPTLLISIALFIFTFGSPLVLSKFLLLESIPRYYHYYWGILITCLVIAAVIMILIRHEQPTSTGLSNDIAGPIKGLLAFGYQDSDTFKKLGREKELRFCLDSITDVSYNFGILSGESGVGKTSFIQAGLWPLLKDRGYIGVYVRCSDISPLESIKYSIRDQFCIPNKDFKDLNLLSFLDLASTKANELYETNGLVLFLDQFEQFFIHQRYLKDRLEFIKNLTEWHNSLSKSNSKILIGIRNDYLYRLNELQEALRYSLSLSNNFSLQNFEPSEASSIFQIMADLENLDIQQKLVDEIFIKELSNTKDGLVSPVNLQLLAWMTIGRKLPEDRNLNSSTFRKLGGVDGLLNNFLEFALSTVTSEQKRHTIIEILLSLVDLKQNVKIGILSKNDIHNKISNISIKQTDISEALAWLSKPDVRLIIQRNKGGDIGYELSHEKIIPAIRMMAGRNILKTERANLLLKQRVNEWIGNSFSSRYLLNIKEYLIIKNNYTLSEYDHDFTHQKRLLAKSRNLLIFKISITSIAIFTILSYFVYLNSPWGYIYRIDNQIYSLTKSSIDDNVIFEISKFYLNNFEYKKFYESSNQIQDKSLKCRLYIKSTETALKENNLKLLKYSIDKFNATLVQVDNTEKIELLPQLTRITSNTPTNQPTNKNYVYSYIKDYLHNMKDLSLHQRSSLSESLAGASKTPFISEYIFKHIEQSKNPGWVISYQLKLCEYYASTHNKELSFKYLNDAISSIRIYTRNYESHFRELVESIIKLDKMVFTEEELAEHFYPRIMALPYPKSNGNISSFFGLLIAFGKNDKAFANLKSLSDEAFANKDYYLLRQISYSVYRNKHLNIPTDILDNLVMQASSINDQEIKTDILGHIAIYCAQNGMARRSIKILNMMLKNEWQLFDATIHACTVVAKILHENGLIEESKNLFTDIVTIKYQYSSDDFIMELCYAAKSAAIYGFTDVSKLLIDKAHIVSKRIKLKNITRIINGVIAEDQSVLSKKQSYLSLTEASYAVGYIDKIHIFEKELQNLYGQSRNIKQKDSILLQLIDIKANNSEYREGMKLIDKAIFPSTKASGLIKLSQHGHDNIYFN